MKKFTTSLALFLSGVQQVSGNTDATPADLVPSLDTSDADPVRLHPLNLPGDNMFAAHRSHSSHSSHRSHRSSSGGGSYKSPSSGSSATPLYGTGKNNPTDSVRPSLVTPTPSMQATPQLSASEKRKLQIMRVQIALNSLGLNAGAADGILGDQTKKALKQFQTLKGLSTTGLMTTDTLNALGISAVK